MLHLNVLKTSHTLALFFNPLILKPFSSSKEKQVLDFLSFLDIITEAGKYNEDCCDTEGLLRHWKGLVANQQKAIIINLNFKVDSIVLLKHSTKTINF